MTQPVSCMFMSHLFRKGPLIMLLFFLHLKIAVAQDLNVLPDVDTSYVDLQYFKWSLRAFTTVKYHSVSLLRDNAKVRYVPKDLTAVGLGFSYKFLVLDIGIRLNKRDEERSNRFDIQTSALLGPNLINFGFQRYSGFKESAHEESIAFREDLRITSVNLNYLYLPIYRETSFRTSHSGISKQRKRAGSPLYGGFIGRHVMRTDSSFVPVQFKDGFATDTYLNYLSIRQVGVQAGYYQMLPIGRRFFVTGMLTPGVGVEWGNHDSVSGDSERQSGSIFKLNAFVAAGWSYKSVYAVVNYSIDSNYLRIIDDTWYRYTLAKVKLAIGYKFKLSELPF